MRPDSPLDIVHICPRYAPARGGVESFFVRLSEALAADGHRVRVWTTAARSVSGFTRRESEFEDAVVRQGGVEVSRHALWHPPLRPYLMTALNVLPLGPWWRAVTRRWNPLPLGMLRQARRASSRVDIVHAAGLPYGALLAAGLSLARRTGARLIVSPFLHLGDPKDGRTRKAYLSAEHVWLLQQADSVLVQTRGERDALAACGIAASRLTEIGMAADPADCMGGDRAEARRSLGVGQDEVIVGHLANKSRDKGTLDLLAAAPEVAASCPGVRFVLAGPEMRSFTRAWRAFSLKDRVISLGELDDREKKQFFSAIDLFALPSYVESFGIVILEAALNGVPTIAYRTGGPAELVSHGRTGWLVEPGDVRGLASVIARTARDGAARATAGEAARAAALPRNWVTTIERTRAAYERVLALDRDRAGSGDGR